jgi:A/G-specific adenine glycosylase
MRLFTPLLRWYDKRGRKLPWRDIGDPYRILVSEIMLQQTRVSTVLNYYPAFIERFPDTETLAAASEEEVLAMWSGLGFYRRARNLHACARVLVESYDSKVPSDPEALGALPGIGRYTVGAILSAAHNARLPILDGNVIRVLTRVFSIAGDPKSAKVNRALWRLAEEVLPEDRPGDFNQAIMDLGATVCSRTAPHCQSCPMSSLCTAHASASAEDFPHAGRRAKVTFVERVGLFVARSDGAFLLHRRALGGLLAGMWELPSVDRQGDERPQELASALSARLSLKVEPVECARGEHRFSHRHWTTHIYRVDLDESVACSPPPNELDKRELRWTYPRELDDMALPEASRKTLRPCLDGQVSGSPPAR